MGNENNGNKETFEEKQKKRAKRSHRDVNLYFEGYVKEEKVDPKTGKKKTEYRYAGDYYIFQVEKEKFQEFKVSSAVLTLAATILFIISCALGSEASITVYVGVPELISLIPLCYQIIGLIGLLKNGSPKMTIREYTFGLGHMENSLWAVLLLWAIAIIAHIIIMFIYQYFTLHEFACLALELAATALFYLQWKNQKDMLSKCIHKAKSKYKQEEHEED